MAEQIKDLRKPNCLYSIPRTHVKMDGGTDTTKVFSDLYTHMPYTHTVKLNESVNL